MKLTPIQKIALAVFVCSLLPAYLIANWRYEAKLANLEDVFHKEQSLHQSTDRLLTNCEKNAEHQANAYDATHQICNQGLDIHDHTDHVMTLLKEEKAANEMKWYRNFGLSVAFFNLLAFALYRANLYLKREAN